MADYSFDVTAFRTSFPAFKDSTLFPDAMLSGYWEMGSSYISTRNYGSLSGNARGLALNLMAAHLAQVAQNMANGEGGIVTQATIDKVSVSLLAPPSKNQFQWWLNQTPYGQQYLYLLKSASAGGLYIGGSPIRSSFRNGC